MSPTLWQLLQEDEAVVWSGWGRPGERGCIPHSRGRRGVGEETCCLAHTPPLPRDSPLSRTRMDNKESASVSQGTQGIEMRGSHKGAWPEKARGATGRVSQRD